jgi:hypothetical protein
MRGLNKSRAASLFRAAGVVLRKRLISDHRHPVRSSKVAFATFSQWRGHASSAEEGKTAHRWMSQVCQCPYGFFVRNGSNCRRRLSRR